MTNMAELLCDKTILIVEDEPLIAAYVADLLGDMGCKSVIAVHSVAKAAAKLNENKPDLALLNLQLDGEMSYGLAEMLVAKSVPLIFATGHDAGTVEKEWASYPCLLKPYSADVFSATVAQVFKKTK